MKSPALVALALLALSGAAFAQHDHSAMGMNLPATAATAAPAAMTTGVVRRVDRAGARVTIAHEPLVNLGMPKMTMTFRVRDAKWLDGMKEGDSIRFVADSVNGALTVVAYEPVR